MSELSEVDVNQEVLTSRVPDFVVLQRHDSYQNFPGKDQPEIPEKKLGHLTEAGEQEVRQLARQEIKKILEFAKSQGKKVNFFVLNSPSALEDVTGKQFGKRAEDSGRLVAEEIKSAVESAGADAQLVEFGKSVDGTRGDKNLSEPNYHYVVGSENPMGYKKALVEKFGASGRWEGYHNVPADLEPLRKEVGAERSPDVADRVRFQIRALDRFVQKFGFKTADTINVYWLNSHNDSLRSMVQHGFSAGTQAEGWDPPTGSLMEMKLSDSMLTTEFNGQELKVAV